VEGLVYRTRFVVFIVVAALGLGGQACARELTPEQKLMVAELKEGLSRVRQEITQANADDAAYSGGLIKALIGVRREVLKTNEALIEQRIHAIESGARIDMVVKGTQTDPGKAAELLKEIETQKVKLDDARKESDRYSGGLVKAMSEAAVATNRNTLAMLEQQYFMAKYGLSLPPTPAAAASFENKMESAERVGSVLTEPTPKTGDADEPPCLKISTFDSSVLSSNEVYTEVAWKVDVSNGCDRPFSVRVNFTLYDKDEFELDSDHEDVFVPARGTGKARGKMLVSPPEKARRMARQGASLSLQ
jgi:hypothetical protein